MDAAQEALGLDRSIWRYNEATRSRLYQAHYLTFFKNWSEGYKCERGKEYPPLEDYMGRCTWRKELLEFELPKGVKFVKRVSLDVKFGKIYMEFKAYISVILKQSNDTRQLTLLLEETNKIGERKIIHLKIDAESVN